MKGKIIVICIIAISVIATISNFADKSIDGKTIVFLGDSLMAGYGNNDRGFEYYWKSALPNSTLINHARGGSTITDNTGDDDIVILNQVKSLNNVNPDVIIFDGGANDILGYAMEYLDKNLEKDIGTVEEDKNKMSDPNTVIGDLEEIIIALQNKFPNAKLYYLQLFLIDDETIDKITINESIKPELKKRRDELYSQIKVLCKKRNVGYLQVSDRLLETEKKYRQDDWIHINEEGYKILSPYILKELQK